jgi:hypothetical protein
MACYLGYTTRNCQQQPTVFFLTYKDSHFIWFNPTEGGRTIKKRVRRLSSGSRVQCHLGCSQVDLTEVTFQGEEMTQELFWILHSNEVTSGYADQMRNRDEIFYKLEYSILH